MAFEGLDPVAFESVSFVTATPKVDLGVRRVVGGHEYVYCHNAGNAQISQGMAGLVNSANSGYSVSVSNAASQVGHDKVVGVVHNATIPTGEYGWLMSRGVALVALDASQVSMNSGDKLALGVDGGFVVATATLSTGIPLGFMINSGETTVGTGKAWFKSLYFSG